MDGHMSGQRSWGGDVCCDQRQDIKGEGRMKRVFFMVSAILIVSTSSFAVELHADTRTITPIAVHRSGSRGIKSKFTSILDKDCTRVNPLRLGFTNVESASECPAPKGWRLFKVYDRDSERSWLNLAKKDIVWSTADQVRINPRYFFGYFPNIDYSPNVEWRISENALPIALIFRVAVTDPNPDPSSARVDSWLSRLYVIGLEGDEPRFCGTTITNEEARRMADEATDCNEALLKEPGN